VLQASLEAGAHYLDLCGDSGYCESCKTECFRSAEMKGIAAVTGGGVIPGISNVMAGRLIQSFLNADVDVPSSLPHYFLSSSIFVKLKIIRWTRLNCVISWRGVGGWVLLLSLALCW